MRLAIAVVLTCALLLTGCKKPPTVVGHWTTNFMGYDATVNFNEDKTGSIEAEVDTLFGKAKGSAASTYTFQDNRLVVTIKNLKITGIPEIAAEQAKGVVQDKIGDNITGNVIWTGDDEFTVTRTDGQVATLVRQKTSS